MNNLHNILQKIQEVSVKTEIKVYTVGGYVRDLVIFAKESSRNKIEDLNTKDVDFVVLGSGLEFVRKLDEVLKEEGSLVPFEDFDTARYIFENGLELEFAGARSEEYEIGSRKPVVVQASLEADLSRRDFTVNAMALSVEDLLR
jgi:tRNA nucleotidyltransferase/poly(A) polymerase